MSNVTTGSNTTAPTQFLEANGEKYAYRRFGQGTGHPLLFLQHFTGTLDNWDPAVTDPLASGREHSVRQRRYRRIVGRGSANDSPAWPTTRLVSLTAWV
jgi:pimeloyl-ACP methyl ester carboxylesterase